MPHLQFDLNFAPSTEQKGRFARAVVRHFSGIMDTGTDHIAITFRCSRRGDLVFGRAGKPTAKMAFLDADIRRGRTADQKRRLALAIMGELEKSWRVPRSHVYVIYTEHDGENFQLDDRVLPSWSGGEDPLADPLS